MAGKVLKYEKRVEVDHSRDNVLLQKECVAGDPCRTRLIFPEPSPNILIPSEQDRVAAVDAADLYLYNKSLDHEAVKEDVHRAIFAGGFYMGLCAMTALMWFLGYFKIGV